MRTSIKLTLVASLAVLVAACASSESPAGNQVGQTPGAQDLAQNTTGKRVRECRYAESTGSNLRRRICHSQEQWAQIDAATAEAQNTDAFFRGTRENATLGAGAGASTAMPAGGTPGL